MDRARRCGGGGGGRAVSLKLAKLLGGDISVRSTPGYGSQFTFWVDVGPVEQLELVEIKEPVMKPQRSHDAAALQRVQFKGRVLVAEDGPDNQRLIQFLLRKLGLVVQLVEHGRAAVEQALQAVQRHEPFDLIFMDMQMPEMDGYKATGVLRDAGYTGPVVALTAHAMSGDRERCLEAGCDDYMTKQIERPALEKLMRKYLPEQEESTMTEPPSKTTDAIVSEHADDPETAAPIS